MRIKVVYRKNLKMTTGKVAAQVAHAVKNLGETPEDCSIVVLKVSDKKFDEHAESEEGYMVRDHGKTEVDPGTRTAFAWIDSAPTNPEATNG